MSSSSKGAVCCSVMFLLLASQLPATGGGLASAAARSRAASRPFQPLPRGPGSPTAPTPPAGRGSLRSPPCTQDDLDHGSRRQTRGSRVVVAALLARLRGSLVSATGCKESLHRGVQQLFPGFEHALALKDLFDAGLGVRGVEYARLDLVLEEPVLNLGAMDARVALGVLK
jgi:hypothetical protein